MKEKNKNKISGFGLPRKIARPVFRFFAPAQKTITTISVNFWTGGTITNTPKDWEKAEQIDPSFQMSWIVKIK